MVQLLIFPPFFLPFSFESCQYRCKGSLPEKEWKRKNRIQVSIILMNTVSGRDCLNRNVTRERGPNWQASIASTRTTRNLFGKGNLKSRLGLGAAPSSEPGFIMKHCAKSIERHNRGPFEICCAKLPAPFHGEFDLDTSNYEMASGATCQPPQRIVWQPWR